MIVLVMTSTVAIPPVCPCINLSIGPCSAQPNIFKFTLRYYLKLSGPFPLDDASLLLTQYTNDVALMILQLNHEFWIVAHLVTSKYLLAFYFN